MRPIAELARIRTEDTGEITDLGRIVGKHFKVVPTRKAVCYVEEQTFRLPWESITSSICFISGTTISSRV